MIKKDKTTIVLTIATISFVGSVVLYGYLYASFQNKKVNVASLRDSVTFDQTTINELEKAEQNLKTTLGTGDRLSALFIRQEAIVDFIQVLENLMKENNLSGSVESVTEISDPSLEPLNKEYLSLKISAGGGFNGISKFVSLLEKIPYKSTIDSVVLTKITGDKNTSSVAKDKNVSLGGWQAAIDLKAIVIKSDIQNAGTTTGGTNTINNNE